MRFPGALFELVLRLRFAYTLVPLEMYFPAYKRVSRKVSRSRTLRAFCCQCSTHWRPCYCRCCACFVLTCFSFAGATPALTMIGLDPASSLLDLPRALSISSVLPQAALHSACDDNEDEHTCGACEVRHAPRSDVMCVDETVASPPASTGSLALILANLDVDGELRFFECHCAHSICQAQLTRCLPVFPLQGAALAEETLLKEPHVRGIDFWEQSVSGSLIGA